MKMIKMVVMVPGCTWYLSSWLGDVIIPEKKRKRGKANGHPCLILVVKGYCAGNPGYCQRKLHHRRPQTVGGFKKCFGEQGQRHEIAATGLMNISAKSATDHFVYVYFVRLRLLSCNARCRKTTKEASDGGASIWFQTLEASSIGLSNWMC